MDNLSAAAMAVEHLRIAADAAITIESVFRKDVEMAHAAFYEAMTRLYPSGVVNVQFEHVDASGYWFSYSLPMDQRRQLYAVRHCDIQK